MTYVHPVTPSDAAPPRANDAVRLEALTAGYGDVAVLRDLNLEIPAGTLTAVLGASGSGKTTMLRVIAGFLRPTAGVVRIGDRLVAGPGTWVAPEHRRVGIVPQEGALFPHRDVLGNVMFGLRRGQQARAMEVLEWVGMADRAQARPQELSGGQQQRVALARALAPEPEVILLDEPFSALDAGLRSTVREQVRAVLKAAGTTAVLVTHDQDEALSMADQVAVMVGGEVVQSGTPQAIYETPATLPVARFVGDVVELPGEVDRDGVLRCALGVWPGSGATAGLGVVVIRPEDLRVSSRDDSATAAAHSPGQSATIRSAAYHGHDSVVTLELPDDTVLTARIAGLPVHAPGDQVTVSVQRRPLWFPAQ